MQLVCDISSLGSLGIACLLVGLQYNTTVQILVLNFDPSKTSGQGLVPGQATSVQGLSTSVEGQVTSVQEQISGIPPVIGDCLLFLRDNRTIQELSLRGHVLSVKMLRSLCFLIASRGLPSLTRLEYMVSRVITH